MLLSALQGAGEDLRTGETNTGVGSQALREINSGANNIGLGNQSGRDASPSGRIDTENNVICLGNKD